MPDIQLQSFDLAGATPTLLLLLKVTAVLLIAVVLTALMQRASATSRHLVWVASLAALVAIPLLTIWTPVHLAVLPASWSTTPAFVAGVAAQRASPASGEIAKSSPSAEESLSAGSSIDAFESSRVDGAAAVTVPAARASITPSALDIVALVWGTVALALLGWLAYGALSVRRIVRSSIALDDSAWQSTLIDIADRLELQAVPRLLSSAHVTMPFAAGLWQPTIVMPSDCESWSTQRRAAVLLHELAHIRRRDIVAHTLGRIVCAVYWFHPLAWTAARRLRAESERACDDLALNCGTRASDYAEHLLEIVTSVRNHGTPSMAMAMATRSEFEGRMLAILDPTLARTSPTRMQASTLAGGVMMFAIVAGAATPKVAQHDVAAAAAQNAAPMVAMSPDGDRPQEVMQASVESDTGKRSRKEDNAERRDARRDERDAELEGRPDSRAEAIAEARAEARAEVRLEVGSDDMHVEIDERALAQIAAVRGVGNLSSKADSLTRASVLARVLRTDTSASLRRTAAWGLNDYTRSDAALEALLHAVRRDASTEVREMAAWSLSDAADQPRVATALAEALREERDRKVRSTLVWSIGEGGSSRSAEAVAALASMMLDDDEKMRELAVWGIGNMEPKKAPAALIAALNDRSPGIRRTAAWALYQIEDGDAAGALESALQRETDRDVKWAMVRALSVM
ncbi:MAG TPA: M56 family metallopeptidase, partial [Gemmatimonadaceae bacterium]|nr:M56 family metallopeptidase [Gemmatimonadaceae bacterium]